MASLSQTPFIVLYGAPIYALLASSGMVNYLTSSFVGALPGVAWAAWTRDISVVPILLNGFIVADLFLYFMLRPPKTTATSFQKAGNTSVA